MRDSSFSRVAANKSYDIIITDFSDPVGPADSLFKKPYFLLLHDALTPGGDISTQGECLWLLLANVLASDKATWKSNHITITNDKGRLSEERMVDEA